jgi:hypothetical protein
MVGDPTDGDSYHNPCKNKMKHRLKILKSRKHGLHVPKAGMNDLH